MNLVTHFSTLVFAASICSSSAFAKTTFRTWGTETHGGDSVVQDFIRYGQNLEILFPFLRTKILSPAQIGDLKNAIETAQISSQDTVSIDGQELDAVNNPALHTIVINRSRWIETRSDVHSMRSALALHEFLWLAEIDDTNYRVSIPLEADLINARNLRAKSPISAGLRTTLCSAIITRDHSTIQQALDMGADLEGACGDTPYTCPEGSDDQNRGYGTNDSSGTMDGPVAMAIRNLGDRNFCNFSVGEDPMDDQEMLDIAKKLLAYHPDLKRKKGRDSFISYAAQAGKEGLIRLLTEAGGDPQDALLSSTYWGSHAYLVAEADLEEYVTMGADVNGALPQDLEPGQFPTILASALLSVPSTPKAFIDFLVTNHKIDFCKQTRGLNNLPSMRVGDFIFSDFLPIVKKYNQSCVP